MTDKPDEAEQTICPSCLATDVSFNVLNIFTECRPKVKMSHDDWMFLRHVIEEEIKTALGVPSEEEESAEKVTVQ